MSVDLSTPWVAALNGNNLAPFPALVQLAEDDERPSALRDPGWSKKSVTALTAKISDKKEALWDSILSLYRLKMLEESEAGKMWEDYVCAWFVSRYLSGR
jgi:hypothetical protein